MPALALPGACVAGAVTRVPRGSVPLPAPREGDPAWLGSAALLVSPGAGSRAAVLPAVPGGVLDCFDRSWHGVGLVALALNPGESKEIQQ